MKRLFLVLLPFVLLSLTLPQNASATHFAGSDLTYQCIGGNDYRITFSFYRDCRQGTATAPTSVPVTFQCSSNSQFNFNVTLQPIPGTGQPVTMLCAALGNPCGGTNYGMQEYIYTGVVTLAPCNFWTMSYTSCCRNNSNTIQAPTSQSFYMAATLNNAVAPCNSSPYFTNKPITIMCSGQTMCYNHGAVDPDGDSLSYTMDTPKTTSMGATVTWIGGYSATQPLPSNPPVTLNPVTGDICMTPTMNIISPMMVRVDSWRKINNVWVNVGTVYRDMQVNVVSCNNTLPVLSGMDTTLSTVYHPTDTTYWLEMCLGPTVNFTIKGHDADTFNPFTTGSPHIFFISWNQGIPGATFTTHHNGTDSAYAQFTWTPNISHVSNTPKCFTATIHDEACPYYGTQAFSYCITVRGMYVEIGSDTLLCKGESMTFNAVADTTTQNYIWRLDGNPAGVPLSSTSYTLNTANLAPGLHIVSIETNDGGTTVACPGLDQVNVQVVYQPDVNLGNDTLVCDGAVITLDAGQGTAYGWSTGAVTQTIQVNQSGFYVASVDGGNGTRCTDSDTILVNVVPMPVVDLGPDTCSGTPIDIDAGNDPNTFQYIWSNGASTQTQTITSSGTYSVTVTAAPGSGCEQIDSKVVNIITGDLIITEKDGVNIGPGDQTMCTHQQLAFKAPTAPAPHTYNYIWTLNGQPHGTGPATALTMMPEGTYTLAVNVGGGCEGSIKVTVEYCELIIPNIITPNGDGYNEKFEITGLEYYPGSVMVIYNRWGKKIFESSSYSNTQAWDADNMSDGIYYYVFKIADGRDTERSGTVTVMR
jgi:gliding motility-associated-like protein